MSFLILSGQRAWRAGAEGGRAEEVHSPFISDYIERRDRQRGLRAWTAGGGEDFPSSWSRSMTWGGRGRPIAPVEIHYQDATPDGNGGFYYTVNFGVVGGLFHQNREGEERRLFHRESFICDGLSFQPDTRRFIAALNDEDRATHLVLLDENGRQTRWITEGDSCDARPAWDPLRPDTVLYQTSGIGRRDGGRAENAPWEAAELDLAKGEVSMLWRRDGMDVMLPRRDRQGRLYVLMRPSGVETMSLWSFVRHVALMPWIFVQALFGFVSAFTYLFAQKPLWKSGGPMGKVDQPPMVKVLGKQLEANVKRGRGKKGAGDQPSFVPESWQLWCREPDGSERKIASRVSWFAVDADDTLYYTTGLAIHALRDGKPETVYQGPAIESFMTLR